MSILQDDDDEFINNSAFRPELTCRRPTRCQVVSITSDLFIKYFESVYISTKCDPAKKNIQKQTELSQIEINKFINLAILVLKQNQNEMMGAFEPTELKEFLNDPEKYIVEGKVNLINLSSVMFVLFYLIKRKKLDQKVNCLCHSELYTKSDFKTSFKRNDELIKFFFKKHNHIVMEKVIPAEKRKLRAKFKKEYFNKLLADNLSDDENQIDIQKLYNEQKDRQKSNKKKRYKVIQKSIRKYKKNKLTKSFYDSVSVQNSYQEIKLSYNEKEKKEKINLILQKFDKQKEMSTKEYLQHCLVMLKEKKVKTFFDEADIQKSYNLFKDIIMT
jgi:hypothetical protein